MADILVTNTLTDHSGVARWLDRACKALAITAGLTLLGMAFMSLWSIVGRALFDKPVLGDFEMVQMLSAVAVAMCLPYAHWIGGHVIVDFFTTGARPRTNALLDLIANLVMAIFSLVIGWRTLVGLLDLRANFDASMLLSIPTWWAYVPLVPSFLLLGLTALYAAGQNLRKLRA